MVQLGEKEQGCTMITGIKKQYPKASKSRDKASMSKKFNCSKTQKLLLKFRATIKYFF